MKKRQDITIQEKRIKQDNTKKEMRGERKERKGRNEPREKMRENKRKKEKIRGRKIFIIYS